MKDKEPLIVAAVLLTCPFWGAILYCGFLWAIMLFMKLCEFLPWPTL